MGLLDSLQAQAQEMVEHVSVLSSESALDRFFRLRKECQALHKEHLKQTHTVYWSQDGTRNIMFKTVNSVGGAKSTPENNWGCNIEELDETFPIWRFARIPWIRSYNAYQEALKAMGEARKAVDHSALPDGIVVQFKTRLNNSESYTAIGWISHQTAETYIVQLMWADGGNNQSTARIKKERCTSGIEFGGRALTLLVKDKSEWAGEGGRAGQRPAVVAPIRRCVGAVL